MTNVAAGDPKSPAPQLFIPAGWKGEGQPPLYTAAQVAALKTGNHEELAHELFAAAQLAPGEGIEDAVSRIAAALTAAHAQPAAPQGVAYAELPATWAQDLSISISLLGMARLGKVPPDEASTARWRLNELSRALASNGQAPAAEPLCWLRAATATRPELSFMPCLPGDPDGYPVFLTAPAPTAQAAPAAPHPIAPDVAADLERSDWTPEEALRWYAAGKHYDTVPNGDGSSSARILDNGAVASNALKSLSRDYAEHKGDVALMAAPAAGAVAGPKEILALVTRYGAEFADYLQERRGNWTTKRAVAARNRYRSTFDQIEAMLAASPTPAAQADSQPSSFGSPELQVMILARCVEKDKADSVLEDAARLAKITQAIRDYHFALDNREHGGVAMARAWNAICDVLNMDWVQGAESAARKQGDKHD